MKNTGFNMDDKKWTKPYYGIQHYESKDYRNGSVYGSIIDYGTYVVWSFQRRTNKGVRLIRESKIFEGEYFSKSKDGDDYLEKARNFVEDKVREYETYL